MEISRQSREFRLGDAGVDNNLGSFADPTALHDSIDFGRRDTATLREMARSMIRIRLVEERIGEAVAAGHVKCPCHLAIGQEAVPVGIATALARGDRLFGAHRSHGHYLALGGSTHRLMAEVQGKDTGASRGMGGSMHLVDTEHGLYGTVPIVGATIPIAVGAALAAKMDGRQGIAVAYFGDGATEEGSFHESMNLAATHRLPVLFVCENNLFSSHLHIELRQPRSSVARYAEAHAVPWARIDGNDVVEIADYAQTAATAMREGQGPRFIEAVTYRWRGHVGPREDEDVGVKRKEDLHLWKGRDPIRRLADAMIAARMLTREEHEADWAGERRMVADSWERASTDPLPPEEALLGRVYSRKGNER